MKNLIIVLALGACGGLLASDSDTEPYHSSEDGSLDVTVEMNTEYQDIQEALETIYGADADSKLEQYLTPQGANDAYAKLSAEFTQLKSRRDNAKRMKPEDKAIFDKKVTAYQLLLAVFENSREDD